MEKIRRLEGDEGVMA